MMTFEERHKQWWPVALGIARQLPWDKEPAEGDLKKAAGFIYSNICRAYHEVVVPTLPLWEQLWLTPQQKLIMQDILGKQT